MLSQLSLFLASAVLSTSANPLQYFKFCLLLSSCDGWHPNCAPRSQRQADERHREVPSVRCRTGSTMLASFRKQKGLGSNPVDVKIQIYSVETSR